MRNMTRLALALCLVVFAGHWAAGQEEAMSDQEIILRALAVSPEYTVPVLRGDGRPAGVFFDFNGDGLRDLAFLTVAGEDGVTSSAAELSDRTRLYQRHARAPMFIVETYYQGGQAVQTVEIGRYPVLLSMSLLAFSADSTYPIAVRVEAQSREGTSIELLLYDGTGMVSRFRTAHTDTQQTLIEDIDGNGTVDIVVTNRLPEAGRGYETFVELYQVTREGLRRSASFPLVRELNRFLASVAEVMAAGDWETLGMFVEADQESDSPRDVLARTFLELSEDDMLSTENDGLDITDPELDIESVTFPEYMENPFPEPVLGESVRVVLRVECCDGVFRYLAARISLARNPFGQRRFAFLTYPFGRQ